MKGIAQLFITFFRSRDGAVALGVLVLFAIVVTLNTVNPWINFLARVGNFIVVGYILYRAVGKQAKAYLTGHKEGIAKELDSLEQQKQEAEQQLLRLKNRMDTLESECQAILEESKKQAEALKETILAKAHEDAKAIQESAVRAADSDVKQILADLREQLADDIALSITNGLQSKLDDTKHGKLIETSLKKVVLH